MAASGLFQRGLFEMALEAYKEFLSQHPDHPESATARYGVAVCHYRLGHYKEAVEDLQGLAKDAKFKQRDEALAVLGHSLLVLREYPKALPVFEELLKEYPKGKHAETAALNRAQVLYLLNRHEESVAACQDFLKTYPASARRGGAMYFMACSQSGMGKHGEAAESLTKLLKEDKNTPYLLDATLLLGQCLENQNKLDAAAAEYRSFLKSAPPDRQGEGHYSLGLALYKAGKYGDSIKELGEVVSQHGDSRYAGAARLQLGLAQLAAGAPGEARKTLAAVEKGDAERAAKARYWLVQCDMAEQKYDSARAALESLAKSKPAPENLEAVEYDLAVCAMELGQFEKAAGEFAAFEKKHPEGKQSGDALYRQAFCFHKIGRYEESQKLCQQAAKAAGAPAAAVAELSAENLFLMGKSAEAAKAYQDLLKAGKPDERQQLRFQFRLGQCAFLAGDYAQAVELLKPVAAKAAASKDKLLHDAVFFLGDAQFQTGQFKEAARSFSEYLGGPADRRSEAQFKLGLAQLKAEQFGEAAKSLQAAGGGQAPWSLQATFAYGQMAYHKLHDPAKAAEALEKLLKAGAPEELGAPALYLLGVIDFDAKNYDRAAQRFAELLKRYDKHELASEAALQQAVCAKEAGKNPEAIDLLNAYVKKYPKAKRVNEAKQLISACLGKMGKQDQAVEALQALAEDKNACSETVLYELAWAQRARKADAEAVKVYRQLLEKFPDGKLVSPARTELAELLYAGKKSDQAAQLLEQVLADPKTDEKTAAVARYRLGWCYGELSDPAKAAKVFDEFVSKHPKHELAPSARYQIALMHVVAKDLPTAKKDLQALLEKYPDSEVAPVGMLKLGEVQAAEEDYPKSAATYEDFLKKYPNSEFIYLARFGIGWAMENQKKYDEARKWYGRVTADHNGPTAARAQFQIGECCFAEGNLERPPASC